MIHLYTHVAILIDADNAASVEYMEQVLKLSEYYGELETCRAYSDWRLSPPAKLEKIDALKIDRVQVNNVGKNATDHGLLLEAGEILGAEYSGKDIRFFILVSGDGDFTSACHLIREKGRQVIVIGNRNQSAGSLKKACDQFYCLEDLSEELINLEKLHPAPPKQVREFSHLLSHAYYSFATGKEYIWVAYDQLDTKLREAVSDFQTMRGFECDYEKYPLSEWLKNFDKEYEANEKEQRIRKIDPDIEYARYSALIRAYIDTKGPDDLALLDRMEEALRRDPNYHYRFGDEAMLKWLEVYPERFEIRGHYVFYNRDWRWNSI